MIQKKTSLVVVDNSGASRAKSIHLYNKGRNRFFRTRIGGLVKVSIRKVRRSIPKKRIRKGDTTTALIVSDNGPFSRGNGLSLKTAYNFVVLLNKDLSATLSNRIVSPVFSELRGTNYSRIIIMAPGII